MLTNFDYLKKEEKFLAFADVAISAEKIVLIDPCLLYTSSVYQEPSWR